MIRIIGYGRESTREQAEEGFNLDEQQRRIQEYVDLYYSDQEISFEMIREEGASAKTLNRPQMQGILEKIENGAVDVLIIHNLDRLTRTLVDMHRMIDLFEQYQVQLISLREHVDTTTPQGRLFVSVMVLIAQWERETIADRTTRGMQESARQGNYAKPKIPFGYYRNPENTRRLLIDDEQAKVVRTLFSSIASGNDTPFSIARRFRKEKIHDRKWTDATVLAIVQNKAYFGAFEWHGEMYTDHVPAIVDKELWDRANAMVQGRDFKKHSYLFKNQIRCKDCGCECEGTCTTKKNGVTYLYYKCPSCRAYMNESRILASAEGSLNEMVISHYNYDQLRKLQVRYKKAERQILQLEYDRKYHALGEEYYQEMLAIYTEEKEELEKEIRTRKEIIQNLGCSSLTREELLHLIGIYVDRITVNYHGYLAEVEFNDEYRRIMQYVS